LLTARRDTSQIDPLLVRVLGKHKIIKEFEVPLDPWGQFPWWGSFSLGHKRARNFQIELSYSPSNTLNAKSVARIFQFELKAT
ncbi:MAG: hypothetical protein KDD42_04735, partial [Bdellovibrionales bacterium]|nr:hypothetical protein [Bdellovibrionales bacterium]